MNIEVIKTLLRFISRKFILAISVLTIISIFFGKGLLGEGSFALLIGQLLTFYGTTNYLDKRRKKNEKDNNGNYDTGAISFSNSSNEES